MCFIKSPRSWDKRQNFNLVKKRNQLMKIQVKVFPKSSREEIIRSGNIIKAYVKAAPDKGKANKALIELIAKEYSIKKSNVSIVSGKTSRIKTVEVVDCLK